MSIWVAKDKNGVIIASMVDIDLMQDDIKQMKADIAKSGGTVQLIDNESITINGAEIKQELDSVARIESKLDAIREPAQQCPDARQCLANFEDGLKATMKKVNKTVYLSIQASQLNLTLH